jgi:hypothetical protein
MRTAMSSPRFLAQIAALNLLQDNGPRVLARHRNLCHAAALALVGWYLMTAPSRAGWFDPDAPLLQWTQAGSFDTASKCEQIRTIANQKFLDKFDVYNRDTLEKVDPLTAVNRISRCIASDDPRLKGK